MDWQTKFIQLYGVIDPDRSFPRDFDFEANADNLIGDARAYAGTDVRVELAAVKAELAAKDEAFAAEQRMKAAGVTQADIDAVKARG